MQKLLRPVGPVLVLTGGHPRLSRNAIHNPHTNGSEDGSVRQVDSKRVVTQPDEKSMREELLEDWRDENGDGSAHDEERRGTTMDIGPLRYQKAARVDVSDRVHQELVQVARPWGIVLVLLGIRTNVTTNKKKHGRDNEGEEALVTGNEVLRRSVLRELGEESSQSKHGAKSFCKCTR